MRTHTHTLPTIFTSMHSCILLALKVGRHPLSITSIIAPCTLLPNNKIPVDHIPPMKRYSELGMDSFRIGLTDIDGLKIGRDSVRLGY